MVRTWEIETLMPFAVTTYQQWGIELGVPLIRQANILDFHPTPQMKLTFAERHPIEKEYLRLPADENRWQSYFNYHFGYGEIDPCWLVDLNTLLCSWRAQLKSSGALLEENFQPDTCEINKEGVMYRDIRAKKIFFCDGVNGFENPFFHLLPYAKNKGEALLVSIPDLPREHIYKQGITLVPWGDDLFWVGSSYEWEFTNSLPSAVFRQKTELHLTNWLKLPFTVTDHLAAERPANMERRPFVGLHPHQPSAGILNGLGTKGCSLAPYFSKQLADHVIAGKPILPQADVGRFSRILSR